MRDLYGYVESERQAEEADIPVWDELYFESRLGGAANVAHNLVTLSGGKLDVYLAGVAGDPGFRAQIREIGINTDLCFGKNTMSKCRYVNESTKEFVARFDNFKKFKGEDVQLFESILKGYLQQEQFDVVVVSDYNKGTVSESLAKAIKEQKLVVVDSKRPDLRIFEGMQVLKLNEDEYARQVSSKDYLNFERLFKDCVITKGAQGAELRQHDFTKSLDKRYVVHSEQFPLEWSANAVDVTGCGDTHTAAMACALVFGKDIRAAIRFANQCASLAVEDFGTIAPKIDLDFSEETKEGDLNV